MKIIPVLDVRHGVAVRAERGQRDSYRPLATPLAAGSDPVAVARGLMGVGHFATLYLADLDGIEGRGRNMALVEAVSAALPDCELWVDAGLTPGGVATQIAAGEARATPVLGTESLAGLADVAALRALRGDAYVLSLDFKDGRFVGPEAVLSEPQHWPRRLIVMTLARVGSGEGPDWARLSEIISLADGRAVYAAGGVRHAGDLAELERLGCAGALVASALHAGKITAGDLNEIAGRR